MLLLRTLKHDHLRRREMKASGILQFFLIVLCVFFAANNAFAGYTNWKYGADKGGVAVSTGSEVPAVAGQDMTGQGAVKWDMTPRLSLIHAGPRYEYSLLDHSAEMFKVLSALRTRVKDERLFKKIAEKLPTLSDERLRIAVSLSDRMSTGGHSVKKDFAFLLLTTLIVFS